MSHTPVFRDTVLEAKLAEAEKMVAEIADERDDFERERDEMEAERDDFERERDELEEERDELMAERDEARDKVKELEGEVATLKKEAENAHRVSDAVLEKHINYHGSMAVRTLEDMLRRAEGHTKMLSQQLDEGRRLHKEAEERYCHERRLHVETLRAMRKASGDRGESEGEDEEKVPDVWVKFRLAPHAPTCSMKLKEFLTVEAYFQREHHDFPDGFKGFMLK